MKSYTVDLGSFNVEAENEEEAEEKAIKMIEDGGWVMIDQIFEDTEI